MIQYKQLLKDIKEKGVLKPAARENIPGTISLFGYQNRYNLSEGFPLVTTKKMPWKGIVAELLWFLKGDTNIKFLIDNGCNIWNEDAYNYYVKLCKRDNIVPVPFIEFEESLKIPNQYKYMVLPNFYTIGDCGKQYGWLWRNWDSEIPFGEATSSLDKGIDQLKELIEGLKNNPMSRRHIISAWNPATLEDMALNACHAFVQFNCRPISMQKRYEIWNKQEKHIGIHYAVPGEGSNNEKRLDEARIPKYYLDCQLYQRSADVVLGVPFNIASYALLTEILAKICNMIPGEFVHTFGDVHIYENHLEAVEEQLQREPRELPKLNINTEFWQTENGECGVGNLSIDGFLNGLQDNDFIRCLLEEDIQLSKYNPHPKLQSETKLSTGLY